MERGRKRESVDKCELCGSREVERWFAFGVGANYLFSHFLYVFFSSPIRWIMGQFLAPSQNKITWSFRVYFLSSPFHFFSLLWPDLLTMHKWGIEGYKTRAINISCSLGSVGEFINEGELNKVERTRRTISEIKKGTAVSFHSYEWAQAGEKHG